MRRCRSAAPGSRGAALPRSRRPSFACGGGGGGGSSGAGAVNPAYDMASVTPTPQDATKRERPGEFAADYLRDRELHAAGGRGRLPGVAPADAGRARPPARPPRGALQQARRRRGGGGRRDPGLADGLGHDARPRGGARGRVARDLLRRDDEVRRDLRALRERVQRRGPERREVVGLSYRGTASPSSSTAPTGPAHLRHDGGGRGHGARARVRPPARARRKRHAPDHVPRRFRPSSITTCTRAASCTGIIHVPFTVPNLGDEDFAQYDAPCLADLQAFGGLGWPGLESTRVHATVRRPSESVAVGVCPCGRCLRTVRAP